MSLSGIAQGLGGVGADISKGLMEGEEIRRRHRFEDAGKTVVGQDGQLYQVTIDPKTSQLKATKVAGMPEGKAEYLGSQIDPQTGRVLGIYKPVGGGPVQLIPMQTSDGKFLTEYDPDTLVKEARQLVDDIQNPQAKKSALDSVNAEIAQHQPQAAFNTAKKAAERDAQSSEIFGRSTSKEDVYRAQRAKVAPLLVQQGLPQALVDIYVSDPKAFNEILKTMPRTSTGDQWVMDETTGIPVKRQVSRTSRVSIPGRTARGLASGGLSGQANRYQPGAALRYPKDMSDQLKLIDNDIKDLQRHIHSAQTHPIKDIQGNIDQKATGAIIDSLRQQLNDAQAQRQTIVDNFKQSQPQMQSGAVDLNKPIEPPASSHGKAPKMSLPIFFNTYKLSPTERQMIGQRENHLWGMPDGSKWLRVGGEMVRQ